MFSETYIIKFSDFKIRKSSDMYVREFSKMERWKNRKPGVDLGREAFVSTSFRGDFCECLCGNKPEEVDPVPYSAVSLRSQTGS